MKNNSNKQQGSALLTALFIMILITIITMSMLLFVSKNIHQTSLFKEYLQGVNTLSLSESWAVSLLKNPKINLNRAQNNGTIQVITFHDYPKLHAELIDAQSRFNINNLSDSTYIPTILNILSQVLSGNPLTQNNLLTSLIIWINPYQPGRGNDTMMSYYRQQKPPYLPGFQFFQSLTELRLLFGMTPEKFQKLSPHLTALPEAAPLNIYTAEPLLIKSLLSPAFASKINMLLTLRAKPTKKSQESITQLLGKWNVPMQKVTFSSSYFWLNSSYQTEHITLHLSTLYHRAEKKDKSIEIKQLRRIIN